MRLALWHDFWQIFNEAIIFLITTVLAHDVLANGAPLFFPTRFLSNLAHTGFCLFFVPADLQY